MLGDRGGCAQRASSTRAPSTRLFADQAERPDDTTALAIWALMVHEVWREQFQRAAAAPPPSAVRGMIGHLAYATGSPCPTLVLDAGRLPPDEDAMLGAIWPWSGATSTRRAARTC